MFILFSCFIWFSDLDYEKNRNFMSNKKLAANISSMSLAVFISRILGLVRDIIMTSLFGTSYVADAFQVGYQIPNLLRKLFGEGALSAAFIPIYNEIGINKEKKQQLGFALNVLSLLSFFLLVLCVLGIILAPLIVGLLAPGFDDRTYSLAVKLTRVIFPYLFLIGFSSTLLSILNSHNYFFVPGLSSAFLNVGMIGSLGIYLLFSETTTLESKVYVVSLGVIFGGILQTIINFPLLRKIGYRLRIDLGLKGEALTSVWRRFLPGVVGLAIRQINLAVDLILASFLVTGSIAALNYGNRLMQLPLGIFGVSAGVAVLPLFSRCIVEKKWDELRESLRFSMISLSFIMLPVTAIIAGLGKDFIRILFMRGEFDEISLNMTYRALLFYSLGLLFFSYNRLIIPIFYANKDTKTPVKISAFIVLINIALNIILMQFMQHAGLALATTISAVIQFFVLLYFMKRKIPEIVFPNVLTNILKISLIAILNFIGILILNQFYHASTFQQAVLKSIFFGTFSILFFLFSANVLKIEYSREIKEKLWKKLRKK